MDDHYRSEAKKRLEDLQRRVHTELGTDLEGRARFAEGFWPAFIDQMLQTTWKDHPNKEQPRAEAEQRVRHAQEEAPSRYEQPEWYALLTGMIERLEGVLTDHNQSIIYPPLFGTLPIGRVQAMAISFGSNPYRIILLEEHFSGLQTAAWKVEGLPSPRQMKCRTMACGTARSKEAAFQVIVAYVVGGHPHLAPPYLPDASLERLSSTLRDSMEMFVLAHEYGHLIAGHLDEKNTRAAMLADSTVDEIQTSWLQEFEADAIGLNLMLNDRLKQGYDLAMSFWGADFFFACIDVVEHAVGILRDGEEQASLSPTHPPTSLRRQAMRELLRRSVTGEDPGMAEGVIQLSETVHRVVDQLWADIRPRFLRMRADAIQPAPFWRH